VARDIGHVLHDIVEAIDRVFEATQGCTLTDFEADWRTKYAVQRRMETISEASRSIPDELRPPILKYHGPM
jgi:uncharacterized protein with HEPN domain